MTETAPLVTSEDAIIEDLRTRADLLEKKLEELQHESEARVIRAELKAEAIRAGVIDADGLKLLDISELRLSESGELEGASALMARFKKAKPWLFAPASSSTAIAAPLAQPPQQKHATEMTDAEYVAARAALLKRRN